MKCPNCGNFIPEGGRFCTACGTPVQQLQQPAQGYAQTPQRSAPVNPYPQVNYQAPAYMVKEQEKYGIWTILGGCGGLMVIISMFLDYISINFYGVKIAAIHLLPPGLKMFDYEMSSYIRGMESDIEYLMIFSIPLVVLAVIALILLLCKKRVAFGIFSVLTLLGALGVMAVFFAAYGDYADIKFAVGAYLSAAGALLMVISSIIKA
ncbi:MAG: zinc ribbon domain-containing protein [Solobacterium sp.]|nr:zinc ribbon domain-containing protein [Solobacterium sp.]